MKKYIMIGAAAILVFTACNSGSNNANLPDKKAGDTAQATAANTTDLKATPLSEIIKGYLQLKNALAADNGDDAATAGKDLVDAVDKVDTISFTAQQKKAYNDVVDDVRENAEHIGKNAGKIAHQREHFDMLSNDVYDLVKTFGAGQRLYKDFCPMYDNKKGAIWLSETEAIKNPYLGKSMTNCGSIKEELK